MALLSGGRLENGDNEPLRALGRPRGSHGGGDVIITVVSQLCCACTGQLPYGQPAAGSRPSSKRIARVFRRLAACPRTAASRSAKKYAPQPPPQPPPPQPNQQPNQQLNQQPNQQPNQQRSEANHRRRRRCQPSCPARWHTQRKRGQLAMKLLMLRLWWTGWPASLAESLRRWLTSRWPVRQHDRRLGCGAGV